MSCVLNNVDRVPAIWRNEGNLSNEGDVEEAAQNLSELSRPLEPDLCADAGSNGPIVERSLSSMSVASGRNSSHGKKKHATEIFA